MVARWLTLMKGSVMSWPGHSSLPARALSCSSPATVLPAAGVPPGGTVPPAAAVLPAAVMWSRWLQRCRPAFMMAGCCRMYLPSGPQLRTTEVKDKSAGWRSREDQ